MTEILNFIKVLLRHKLILIVIPVIAVVITYFFVSQMPNKYVSKSRLATGIVDNSENIGLGQAPLQGAAASQEFDNLIQMMTLKKIVNQVSYQLIIHDLGADIPFRKKSSLVQELDRNAIRHAKEVYKRKYEGEQELSLWDNDESGLYKVLQSMKYDYESLKKSLLIYRVGSSDFITVEFESENPKLSAFVVNMLCKEFIQSYSLTIRSSRYKAIAFLDSMLLQKQNLMEEQMTALREYKIKNRVLNLNEQAKSLYGQIADFETRREIAKKDVAGYGAALKNIDHKFDPADRKYMESALVGINQEIENTKEELKDANQAYISNGFQQPYKTQMEALQKKLNVQIATASDKYAYNPMAAKENLVSQKLSLETSREVSANSIAVINEEIARLNRKLDVLVPNEAEIESYEKQIDITSREYIELLAKYNAISTGPGSEMHIRQLEPAMPGTALPSKKMLLIILSGIISFAFCVIVLFVLFMLDRSVTDVRTLANETNLPVLGYLNQVRGKELDFSKIWNTNSNKSILLFKDLLRSVRFEIESDLDKNQKIVVITSLLPDEGKTFFTISMAYALIRANKKVLVIDGNFINPTITQTVSATQYLDDLLRNRETLQPGSTLDVIGNKGEDISLLELAGENEIQERLQQLKQDYDVVLIETGALSNRSITKEWMMFADKVVCVFESGNNIISSQQHSIVYLQQLGSVFCGWVLNKVTDENIKSWKFNPFVGKNKKTV
jgi:succinoglycan biosynthesis transport protein ExoP